MLLAFVFGLSLTHHRSMLLVAPALARGPAPRWLASAVRGGRAGRPGRSWSLAPLRAVRLRARGPVRAGLPPGSWPVDTPAAFAEFLLDRGYTSQIRPDAAFGGRLLEEGACCCARSGRSAPRSGLVGLVASFLRDWRLALVLLLAFVPQAVLGASYLLESNYQLPRTGSSSCRAS